MAAMRAGEACTKYTTGFRFESGCPDSITGRMTNENYIVIMRSRIKKERDDARKGQDDDKL